MTDTQPRPVGSVVLKIRQGKQDELLLAGDERMGDQLRDHLQKVVRERGTFPRPQLLIGLPERRLLSIDLYPMIQKNMVLHHLISTAAGIPSAHWVMLLGTFPLRFRQQEESRLSLLCFIEWPDGRWWTFAQGVDQQGLREDLKPIQRCAIYGDPKPEKLGGWFARSRRECLNLAPQIKQVDSPLLH